MGTPAGPLPRPHPPPPPQPLSTVSLVRPASGAHGRGEPAGAPLASFRKGTLPPAPTAPHPPPSPPPPPPPRGGGGARPPRAGAAGAPPHREPSLRGEPAALWGGAVPR